MSAAPKLARDALAGRRFVVHHRRWLRVTLPQPTGIAPLIEAAGYEVDLRRDDTLTAGPDDVLLLLSSATYFPQITRELEELGPRRPLVALWISEPLPMPRSAGLPRERLNHVQLAKIFLRRADTRDPLSNSRAIRSLWNRGLADSVAVLSAERQAHLAEHGVPSIVAQHGSAPEFGEHLGLERDIDVLFLGGLNGRRRRLLRTLHRGGIDVLRAGSWTDPATWGASRTRLLNRVKIELNLSRIPGSFPGQRLVIGLMNGTLPISEPLVDPSPYVAGEHFVEAPVEDFPEVVRHYLDHPDERERIIAAGRALLRTLTLESQVDRVLDQIATAAAERR